MLLTSQWFSFLKSSLRGRVGRQADRGGRARRNRRANGSHQTAAAIHSERLETRTLLSGYTFVKIAESGAYADLGVPALGGNGEVAFKGATSNGRFVLKGSGGAVTTIESSTGPLAQFGDPVINASGQVAFWALADDPTLQVINVGNGVISSTTLVQASSAATTGQFEQLDRRPDFNDDGDIAFMGDKPETTGVFLRSVAGVVTTLAQESDGYLAFPVGETFVSLNNADAVSFNAKLTNGNKTIVRHTGTRTNLRDSSGPLDAFTRSSISQDGDVATSVISDLGVHDLTLLSGNANPVAGTVLVGAAGPFLQFDSPNLTDNNGGIAFFGTLDTGTFGIYTGADPVANKVIENGDSLDGKTVQTIVFSTNGANSLGQIAFLAAFTDGSTAVFRADRVAKDWGDLPETATDVLPSGYKTKTSNGGPSHAIVPGLSIGDSPIGPEVDAEPDGQPTPLADGDNTTGVNDENSLLTQLTRQSFDVTTELLTFDFLVSTAATNHTGQPAYLYIFMDFTHDGDFEDPGEKKVLSVPDGTNRAEFHTTFTFSFPAVIGTTSHSYAVRQRLSTDATLTANGPAPDGEVEDNIVSFQSFIDDFHPRTTETTLTTAPTEIVVGDPVTLTAKVTQSIPAPNAPTVPDPTGTVTFYDRTTVGRIVVGSDPGSAGQVDLLDETGKRLLRLPQPYGSSFMGGVRVAMGDVNGDGVAEIITAPGEGMEPRIKVYEITNTANGLSATEIASFLAGPASYRGGVNITSGDVNGDSWADVVATVGSTVNIFSAMDFLTPGVTVQPHLSLVPFGTGTTRLNVATGDLDGDGHFDIFVAPGLGFAPRIKVFSGATGNLHLDMMPFESSFRGGVSVAAGDLDGDGKLEIVVGKGIGSIPQVKVFDHTGSVLAGGNVYDASFRGGVQVTTADLDGDGVDELVISTVLETIGDRANVEDHVPAPGFMTLPRLGNTGFGSFRINVSAILSSATQVVNGTSAPKVAQRAGNFFAAGTAFDKFLGAAPIVTGGQASLPINTLAAGAHTILAKYSGDANNLGSVSLLSAIPVVGMYEFGDAPASYGTLLTDDGARHGPGGPILGTSVDLEKNGHPSANALGDDTAGPQSDDEDGVTFLSSIHFSDTFARVNMIIVHASAPGFLFFYIDYNHDGVFGSDEDYLRQVVAGDNQISFTVPRNFGLRDLADALSLSRRNSGPTAFIQGGETYARFRISSSPFGSDSVQTPLGVFPAQLGPTGLAIDGEVEDYKITLQNVSIGDLSSTVITEIALPVALPQMDFGDAPASYGTLLSDNGARHGAGGPRLGATVDLERSGHPSANALGDDTAGPSSDDEDGVTFMSSTLFRRDGTDLTSTVIVHASAAGFLDVFIDFNRDGHFDGSSEKLTGVSIPVRAGDNLISFTVPGGFYAENADVRGSSAFANSLPLSVAGDTFARFRISSAGGLSAGGEAADGEVEDYRITIREFGSDDLEDGDAPPMEIQLPSQSASGSASGNFDVFVNDGVLTLAGFSSGGDRSPLFQMPFDGRQRIDIMGTPGDDTLRLDLSGSDVSFQDLHFDGGDQATEVGDGLVIIGGQRRVQDLNFEYTNLNDGVIALDSTRIEFANLEPIEIATFSDHAFFNLSFLLDARYNRLNPTRIDAELVDAGFINTQYADPSIVGAVVGDELLQQRVAATLRGTASVNGRNFVPFEAVTFAIPTISTTLHLGDGSDYLRITSLPGAFARTLLTVRGNGGNDLIEANPSLLTPLIIEGGAGNDQIYGTAAADTIQGGDGNDEIFARNGDDQIFGDAGADSLDGDVGSDVLYGGSGNDTLKGWEGNDLLVGESGSDLLLSGNGNDTLDGGESGDLLYGQSGDDVLIGESGNDTLDGGPGNDSLDGGFENDTMDGGTGNDSLDGGSGNDTMQGSSGNDQLEGDRGVDILNGGEGDDQLSGGDDSDIIDGGTGNDSIDGGVGDDILHAGAGDDRTDGGEGSDELYGAEGNDVLNGQSGIDFIDGGSGNDSLDGGDGADLMSGRDGDDWLTGGRGDDDLSGDAGADSIQGGEGHDWLRGGIGNDVLNDEDRQTVSSDTLDGGSGNDVLQSSAGPDVLVGGTGDDQLDGGIGADTISGDDGNDTIFGGEDNDSLNGGSGADQISGGTGDDLAAGGDGDDRLFGDSGHDSLQGDEGRDVIDGGVGNDQLLGGEDNDTLNGGQGNDLLAGDEDNDLLNGGDHDDTVLGGDDDDVVLGGTGNDSVSGDDGDDRVLGQAGNDTVSAGEGVDTIDGGTGSDAISELTLNATLTPTKLTLVNLEGDTEVETLRGIERAILSAAFSPAGVTLNTSAFRGSVTLFGSAFHDTITSGNGADSINGGFGNDSIIAGGGNDTIDGGGDADTIRGGLGDDSIKGGAGNDMLFGERGHDLLNGGSGNDLLEGDLAADTALAVAGNDSLTGQDGDDTLRGFAGNDVLVGGIGKDSLDGGAGKDTLLGEGDNDTLVGGADGDVLAGGAGTNVFTSAVAGEINEAFMFLGGRPLWIDEI